MPILFFFLLEFFSPGKSFLSPRLNDCFIMRVFCGKCFASQWGGVHFIYNNTAAYWQRPDTAATIWLTGALHRLNDDDLQICNSNKDRNSDCNRDHSMDHSNEVRTHIPQCILGVLWLSSNRVSGIPESQDSCSCVFNYKSTSNV